MTVPIQKLLFVCSRNKLRSLTAETLLAGSPLYQVRSAGTQPGARIVVTAGHLGWADMIFCMEKAHVERLRQRFPEALEGKRVVCLRIPDDYEFMQAELIEELYAKLEGYVTLPERKAEIRSPKAERNPKSERRNPKFGTAGARRNANEERSQRSRHRGLGDD